MVVLFGLVGSLVSNIFDFKVRSVNEDNLINVDNYTLENVDDKDADIQIDIDKYGRIKLDGENKAEEDVTFEVTSVLLPAGEYYVSSNAKGCDDDTYYLVLKSADGTQEIIADNDFVVAEATTFTVNIVVKAGEEIDTRFAPVVNEGDEPVKFFVWFK